MKTSRYLFSIFIAMFSHFLLGQSQVSEPKHSIRMSIGWGYEDGWVSLTKIPTLGIGYEYALGKRIALSGHLMSYYRNMPDSYFDQNLNGARPTLDLIAHGVSGPFITEADLERIQRTGIRRLSPKRTIKSLSLPFDVGITFYPIHSDQHKVGLNAGLSLTYETYNWWRDYYDGVSITLEDGTVYDNLFLSLNTEFRNLSPGISTKIFYEFHFKDYGLGGRVSNYNLFSFGQSNLTVWDTSIYLILKI